MERLGEALTASTILPGDGDVAARSKHVCSPAAVWGHPGAVNRLGLNINMNSLHSVVGWYFQGSSNNANDLPILENEPQE